MKPHNIDELNDEIGNYEYTTEAVIERKIEIIKDLLDELVTYTKKRERKLTQLQQRLSEAEADKPQDE